MKKIQTIVFSITLFLFATNSFSQQLKQFDCEEIISLFEKKQTEINKILAKKSYSYKGKDSGFDKYIKRTSIGEFIVNIMFKDGKIKGISTQEHNSLGNQISIDLYRNSFKVRALSDMNSSKQIDYENHIIPFSGCFYLLNNFEKKITASFIISPYNSNVISLNYSRLLGKEYQNESKKIKEEKIKQEKDKTELEETKLDTITSSNIEKIEIAVEKPIVSIALKREQFIAKSNKYIVSSSTYLYNSTTITGKGKKILYLTEGEKIYSEEKIILKKQKDSSSILSIMRRSHTIEKDFIKCTYFDKSGREYNGFVKKFDISQ